MKKLLAVVAVLAVVCLGSVAFAADVTVGGSVDIRSRDTSNLDLNKLTPDNAAYTQERVRIDVNAKAGDVKGKVTVDTDWANWGNGFEKETNTILGFREAWINFNIPGLPVNVNAGHQLLTLGNGWFFRSNKYGSDAWVLSSQVSNNTIAFADVKISEGAPAASDDIDAYVILDSMKLSDTMVAGIDLTIANDPRNGMGFNTPGQATQAENIGLNFNGLTGPVILKAELDYQMGTAKGGTGGTDKKLKGTDLVIQGTVPMQPVAVNFTVAQGSGRKSTGTDINQFVDFLDADPHYTFLYEYLIGNPGCTSPSNLTGVHAGFCNTMALNVGASMDASKSVNVSANLWLLTSTEKVLKYNATSATDTTNALGTELDVKVNWKLYDNLSWNWDLGYLTPGAGLGKDAAMGVQGILSMKF